MRFWNFYDTYEEAMKEAKEREETGFWRAQVRRHTLKHGAHTYEGYAVYLEPTEKLLELRRRVGL